MVIVKHMDSYKASYSKAWTERGQLVFVELDMDGNIQSQETDLIRIDTSDRESIIPYDIRMGAYECGKKEVSGVALVCGNEICTLTRIGSSPEPVECILTTMGTSSEEKGSSSGSSSGSPIGYPLVRMSDIIHNSKTTSNMIDRATSRLRASGYNECVERLHNIYNSMESMSTAFNEMTTTIDGAYNGLKISILELEQARSNYERFPVKNEEERVRQRRVDRELRARHTMLEHLLRLCYQLSNYHQDTVSLTNKFSLLKKTIHEKYKDVATVQMVPVTPRR